MLNRISGLAIVSILLLVSSFAEATVFTWDTSSASGIQAGSGTWSTSTSYKDWTTNGTTLSAWTSDADAVFAGSTGTYGISVSGTQNANSVTFNTAGYTLSSGALAIKGGGIVANAGATIQSNIILKAAQTWSVASGQQLGVSGNISGSYALTKTGAGTLLLSGSNTYTGATTVSQGTLRWGASNVVPGSLTLVGGTTADMAGCSETVSALTISSGTATVKVIGGAGSAQLAVTGALTLTGNLTLDASGMATSAGLYKLLSYGSKSGCGTVTAMNVNSAYTLVSSTGEYDLQHKADQAITNASSSTINIITGFTKSISATLTNTAPAGSASLAVSLGDNGGTGGAVSGLSSSAGSTMASGSTSTITGTFTAGAVGLGKTWSIKNVDSNAVTATATGGGVVNVYNHSAATLAIGSGNNQTIITGGSLSATAVLSDTANNTPAPLDVNTLVNLAGSSTVASGGTATYTVSGFDTVTTGSGKTLTVSLKAADQQTITGAGAFTTLSATVTYNVLNHSSPILSATNVTVGLLRNAVAGATTVLRNDSGYRAGLQIISLGGLTDSGTGLIAAGSSRALTVAVDTGTSGLYNKSYTIRTQDDESLSGHAVNADKTFTVSGVVGWATADNSNNTNAFGTALIGNVANHSYAGLESTVKYSSGNGGSGILGSTATILSGSATGNPLVSMSWRSRTEAEANGAGSPSLPKDSYNLISDVVELVGLTSGDSAQIQLTYDPRKIMGKYSEAYLAGSNPTGTQWIYLAELVDGQWQKVTGSLVNLDLHCVNGFVGNGIYGVVPEPATLGLLAVGGIGLLMKRRNRRTIPA